MTPAAEGRESGGGPPRRMQVPSLHPRAARWEFTEAEAQLDVQSPMSAKTTRVKVTGCGPVEILCLFASREETQGLTYQ